MYRASRRLLIISSRTIDALIVIAAFSLATWVSVARIGSVSLAEFISMRLSIWNIVLFLLMLGASLAVFSSCGLYRSKRLTNMRSEWFDLTKATTIVTCVLMLFAFVFKIKMLTPLYLAAFWAFAFTLMTANRLGRRPILEVLRRRGRNLRHLLILGSSQRALEFARKIEARPELGYRLIGFADDEWDGMQKFREAGERLCCNISKLPEFLRQNVVDEVAIYLPLKSQYGLALQVARMCEQHGIIVRMNADVFSLSLGKSHPEALDDDLEMMTYSYLDWFYGWPGVFKRLIDISASVCFLVILSPLFLAVGSVIKLTSRGPIFFRQERVGLNKRRFLIFKFRTMVDGAEKLIADLEELNEVSGPVFKIKNDPRVTRVGKLLRRTSIDELPQLLNVLIGDMSLVGPRPLPLRDYEGFSEDWQRRRLSVRPGITCLWQVNGRSSIPFERWMELDIQYLNSWSLWLDVKILAQTIPAVLRGAGAA